MHLNAHYTALTNKSVAPDSSTGELASLDQRITLTAHWHLSSVDPGLCFNGSLRPNYASIALTTNKCFNLNSKNHDNEKEGEMALMC